MHPRMFLPALAMLACMACGCLSIDTPDHIDISADGNSVGDEGSDDVRIAEDRPARPRDDGDDRTAVDAERARRKDQEREARRAAEQDRKSAERLRRLEERNQRLEDEVEELKDENKQLKREARALREERDRYRDRFERERSQSDEE